MYQRKILNIYLILWVCMFLQFIDIITGLMSEKLTVFLNSAVDMNQNKINKTEIIYSTVITQVRFTFLSKNSMEQILKWFSSNFDPTKYIYFHFFRSSHSIDYLVSIYLHKYLNLSFYLGLHKWSLSSKVDRLNYILK